MSRNAPGRRPSAARRSMDHAERGLAVEADASPSTAGLAELRKTSARPSVGARPESELTTVGKELEAGVKEAEVKVENAYRKFWDRFNGKNKTKVGWLQSVHNVVRASWINVIFLLVPIAWASHFMNTEDRWPHQLTFALCFISIIPMENIFEWGGEQMAIYLGKDLGDLVMITLNNAVEAALAIILLKKCELRLLQSTIVGIVVLHLLLVPGTAFLVHGSRILEQDLHPGITQLNHSLLAVGVLTFLLPTAWFAALDRGAQSISSSGVPNYTGKLLTDGTRDQLLRMSRGLAVILLIVYVGSRIYLHDPPGDNNAFTPAPNTPKRRIEQEEERKRAQPKINPWACILLLAVTVAIMTTTVEFMVSSIDNVRRSGDIQEEWFGLILLPIASFAADGCMAIGFFLHRAYGHFYGGELVEPETLALSRPIDLSIQFTLFWTPFLVLLGWWIDKPMHLVFDYFELALLLGSSFLVNYVTADAKTNWVEGLIMVSFYFMIAICAWFYHGQPELAIILSCPESVAATLAKIGS